MKRIALACLISGWAALAGGQDAVEIKTNDPVLGPQTRFSVTAGPAATVKSYVDLNMGSKQIRNLGAGVGASDAVRVDQLKLAISALQTSYVQFAPSLPQTTTKATTPLIFLNEDNPLETPSLIELQVGGTARFVVSNAGGVTAASFSGIGSNLTDLNAGNVSSGTLAIARGGTNTSSVGAAGTIAYSTGTAYGFSTPGAGGHFLRSGGAGVPTWLDLFGTANTWTAAQTMTSNLTVTGEVTATSFSGIGSNLTNLNAGNVSSGTLAIARGGTNTSSVGAAGTIAYSTGTAYGFSASGTSGHFLRSGGAGAPTWLDLFGAANTWTAAQTMTSNLTVQGNTTLGDASTDSVTFVAGISSSLVPTVHNTYDLGTATARWRSAYLGTSVEIDGTASRALFARTTMGSSSSTQTNIHAFQAIASGTITGHASSSNRAVEVSASNAPANYGVISTGTSAAGTRAWGLYSRAFGGGDYNFALDAHASGASLENRAVSADAVSAIGSLASAVRATVSGTGSTNFAGDFSNTAVGSGGTQYGIRSTATGALGFGGSYKYGLYSEASGSATLNYGVFGKASGGAVNYGVAGQVTGDATSSTYAGHFTNSSTSTGAYGIRAEATGNVGTGIKYGISVSVTGGASTNYAIHATASGGTTNYAGFFAGTVKVERASLVPLIVNRTANDGDLIEFRQDDVSKGNISVSGGTVSYQAFTGAHYGWSPDHLRFTRGEVLVASGPHRGLHGGELGTTETVYGVTTTDREEDQRVLGVYAGETTLGNERLILVNAVGDGFILVTDSGGDIGIGDFLTTSSRRGYGQKQASRAMLPQTIARAMVDVRWTEISRDPRVGFKWRLIPCTFRAG